MTTIVLAESSGSNPYAAQKAAVSASAGSHANSSYGTPSGSRCSTSQARPAGSWSSMLLAYPAGPLPSRSMTDRPDDRDWHPEPELVFYGDEATSRAAMERLGADTWAVALDFLYDQAAHRAMGDPARLRCAAGGVLRRDGRTRAGADLPLPDRGRPRRVPRPARGRPDERAAPAPVRLLHAATAAGLDDGRAARPDDQPGRRRVARGPARDLRRGGGRALAVRPRRVRSPARSGC